MFQYYVMAGTVSTGPGWELDWELTWFAKGWLAANAGYLDTLVDKSIKNFSNTKYHVKSI